MSRFYGTLKGNRGRATRCGTAGSGITTQAASWQGCIEVLLYTDKEVDYARVTMRPWHGGGVYRLLYEGPVGEFKPLYTIMAQEA